MRSDLPRMFVVGGVDALVNGNLGRKLREAGADIGWHVPMSSVKPGDIPSDAEGVIVLRDMTGHQLSTPVKVQAKERGLPYASISRKWSEAEPILRAVGILPAAQNDRIKKASSTEVLALGTEYVCGQRESGRNPKQGEVQAVLMRVFGPHFRLDDKAYKDIMRRSIAKVPAVSPIPIEIKVVPKQAEELKTAVQTILDCQPEDATRPDKVMTTLKGLVSFKPDEEVVKTIMAQELLSWAFSDRKKRDEAMYAWAYDILTRVKEGREVYPRQNDFFKRGKPIFGMNPVWDIVKKARMSVFGDWADSLIRKNEAALYFTKRCRISASTFDRAITSGEIPSIPQGNMRYTSKTAVDRYIAEHAPDAWSKEPTPASQVPGKTQLETEMNQQQIQDLNARLNVFETNSKTILERLQALQKTLDALVAQGAPTTTLHESLLALVQGGQVRVVLESAAPRR